MKLLTKQQALKAYLIGYTIVYEDKGKYLIHSVFEV